MCVCVCVCVRFCAPKPKRERILNLPLFTPLFFFLGIADEDLVEIDLTGQARGGETVFRQQPSGETIRHVQAQRDLPAANGGA